MEYEISCDKIKIKGIKVMNCSINIVSLFLTIGKEYLKTIAKRIKKEKDFKSFFLNANNEFVFNELNSDYFDETMQQIFSTDNLKKIASECAKINGFDMKDKIIVYLCPQEALHY